MEKKSKKEISEVAIQLIKEKGYNNVTIMDICDACHITRPTFYKYAGTKEDLILDLYDAPIEYVVNNPMLFIQADTYIERLFITFDAILKKPEDLGPDIFSQLFISNLNENHHSFQMRDSLTELSVLIIEKAQANGEILNPSPAMDLYIALAHTFQGFEINWCILKGEFDLRFWFYSSTEAILNVRKDIRPNLLKYRQNPNKE